MVKIKIMKRLHTVNCPFCGGTGKALRDSNANIVPHETKKKAYELRQKGWTLRAIAKEIGLKNPQSVQSALVTYHRQLISQAK